MSQAAAPGAPPAEPQWMGGPPRSAPPQRPTLRGLRKPAQRRTGQKCTQVTSPASLWKPPISSSRSQIGPSGGSCFQRHFACLDAHRELHLVAAQRLFDLARLVADEPGE